MANRTIYIDNLEAEQIQRFDNEGIEVRTPNDILTDSLEETDALIVLCELNIDSDDKPIKRSKFYGVKLVQELRREKFMGKVLFVSFMGRDYFLNNLLKYKIIALEAGHSFLQLPTPIDEIKAKLSQIERLDHLSFRDTFLFATGIGGSIQEEIHRLSSLKTDFKTDHINLIEEVCEFFSEPKVEILKRYETVSDDFLKAFSFIETETKKLLEKYHKDGSSNIYKPKYSWSILWLDDEIAEKYKQGETIPIVEYIEKEVGIKVIKAITFEEAENIYNNDRRSNTIRVVIADYRLHHTNAKGHSLQNSLQGYHFIEHIIKEDDTMALFAYSGLPRRFLMETFSHYGKKIQSFSKKDFPLDKKEVFGYISDAIVSQGDDAWIEANNQPNAAAWTAMKKTYFDFKSGFDFTTWNKQLNAETLKRISLFRLGNVCELEITTSQFKEGATGKTRVNNLKKILTGRRLAIYLLAEEYSAGNDMIAAKKTIGDYIFMSSGKTPNPKTPDTIFNRLAIEVTDFPMFLLPEENAWLEFESGLNFSVKKKIDKYWSSINYIKNRIKAFYSESEFYQSQLNNYEIPASGEAIAFGQDYSPNIKSANDVRTIFLFIKSNLTESKDLETDFNHFITLWRSVLSYLNSSNEIHSSIESLTHTLLKMEVSNANFEEDINRCLAKSERENFIESLNSISLFAFRSIELLEGNKGIEKSLFTSLLKNYYINITSLLYRNTLRVLLDRIFRAIKSSDAAKLEVIQDQIQKFISSENIQDECSLISSTIAKGQKPLHYNIEDEYIFRIAPWEKIYTKKTRFQGDFNERSDKLKSAIFNQETNYLDDAIYYEDLFKRVLTNFISSNEDRNGIYQHAIEFRKEQAQESLKRSNTDSTEKKGKSGSSISAIENAENINARISFDDDFNYDEFLNSEGLDID